MCFHCYQLEYSQRLLTLYIHTCLFYESLRIQNEKRKSIINTTHNNHHLLNIIHDKLQPLGLSRSETIISFNAIIDRQLPIGELPVEDENDAVDEYGEDE